MFQNGNNTGDFNINNFIRVKSFELSTSQFLEGVLSGTNTNSAIIFSPPGSIYSLSGSVFTTLFKNPMTDDKYQNDYAKYTIKPNKFSRLVSKYATDEMYYVSPPDIVNNNGGGWLLYRDANANYYVLYNPFNRQNFKFDKEQYEMYCSNINYQDPGCYCFNFPDINEFPCVYDASTSKDQGQDLLKILSEANKDQLSSQTIQAINTLKGGNCGCISPTCNQWRDVSIELSSNVPSMNQLNSCSQNESVTICASDISAGKTIVSTSTLTVDQNCNNYKDLNTNNNTNNNTKILITGGVAFLVIIIIIALFYFK